jgi:serine/threonine protein kinase
MLDNNDEIRHEASLQGALELAASRRLAPQAFDAGIAAHGARDDDSLVGTILGGKYELERVCGRGATGTVYVARQLGLDRRVAVKVLSAGFVKHVHTRDLFEREAKLAAQLEHPSVVVVHDFDLVDEGISYLVMELLTGPTLAELLHDRPFPAIETVVGYIAQVAGAVDALHRIGIVHRDLKPANIILPPARVSGVAKVVDFGVARLADARGSEAPSVLRIVGTPGYMAPELLAGAPPAVESDVYALGVTTFEALTGRLPVAASNFGELITHHIHHALPVPSDFRPGIPAKLDAVVRRAIDPSPERRYRSAASFGRDLLDAVATARETAHDEIALDSNGGDDRPTCVASILVVEDDDVVRLMLEEVLASEGYQVVAARDGVEALLTLGSRRFDLILSDVQMPLLDGILLMRALSEKGLTTPVFFLSGALQEESAAELSDLGASAFFAKPISIFPLLEAIRRELRIDESTL